MPAFELNQLITLKDSNWLVKQRIAGKCIADVLTRLDCMINEHTSNLSLFDLEKEALSVLEQHKCLPTFKGYKGFPGVLCLSVNKELVHGIPSKYILQDGDVVKFDIGATFEGAIADAAATSIYGENESTPSNKEMIKVCKESLDNAIKYVKVGNRIGSIGNSISKTVSRYGRYGLVTQYGGHGIDENAPHAPPFVSNKSQPTEGIRIQPGLTIAIEPMLTMQPCKLKVAGDGWTVLADSISCHFEHTVFAHSDNVEVITKWGN